MTVTLLVMFRTLEPADTEECLLLQHPVTKFAFAALGKAPLKDSSHFVHIC